MHIHWTLGSPDFRASGVSFDATDYNASLPVRDLIKACKLQDKWHTTTGSSWVTPACTRPKSLDTDGDFIITAGEGMSWLLATPIDLFIGFVAFVRRGGGLGGGVDHRQRHCGRHRLSRTTSSTTRPAGHRLRRRRRQLSHRPCVPVETPLLPPDPTHAHHPGTPQHRPHHTRQAR